MWTTITNNIVEDSDQQIQDIQDHDSPVPTESKNLRNTNCIVIYHATEMVIRVMSSYETTIVMNDVRGSMIYSFEGPNNKRISERMNVIKYIGDTKYKENPGKQSHKVYLSPEKYPAREEFDSFSDIQENAEIPIQVQSSFKSKS